ncbi:hypothetical protein H109_07709 [Trichophyton interdigitale MR816]|uniref:Uncharacterized protein n=1 Tax=Trichophyton interdigitale (strain MR816) TaxID=1215338 RepID=A0A059IYK3_TRIIM|nr:hypothetical protein H109_07709 [Trichophyton interdigitale MR816]
MTFTIHRNETPTLGQRAAAGPRIHHQRPREPAMQLSQQRRRRRHRARQRRGRGTPALAAALRRGVDASVPPRADDDHHDDVSSPSEPQLQPQPQRQLSKQRRQSEPQPQGVVVLWRRAVHRAAVEGVCRMTLDYY